MIYQVRANVFFTQISDAEDLVAHIALKLDDAVVINPDEPNQQGCSIELIKCYHDQIPTKPCISCGQVKCPPD